MYPGASRRGFDDDDIEGYYGPNENLKLVKEGEMQVYSSAKVRANFGFGG